MTWEEACRHSSTGWAVDKLPLHYEYGDCFKLASGEFALVRRDTGAFLNRVGSVYQVFQNTEAFQFLDAVVGEHKGRFETAGSLHGGRKLWCQVLLPEQTFEVTPGDAVETRATFFNSHGGEAAWCFLTGTRTVCANTFRTAGRDKKKGLSIRHTGDLNAKTAAAQRALGLAVTAAAEFKEAAGRMLATPLPEPRAYFEACLDTMLDLTEAEQTVRDGNVLEGMLAISDAERQAAEKSLERKMAARSVSLNDMLDRYEGEANGINGMRGTAWAGFNAVTEHGNHADRRSKGSSELRQTRRFESVLDGPRDDLMQTAYQMASASVN